MGDRVFGLTDWHRDGAAAEYAAVEARDLAAIPPSLPFTEAAVLPLAGLAAWQALFTHGGLEAGQTVVVHGGGGGTGVVAVQLARQAGAHVIATGRGRAADLAREMGAHAFVDLEREVFEDAVEPVDLIFDTIGGELLARWARSSRAARSSRSPRRPRSNPRADAPSSSSSNPTAASSPKSRKGPGRAPSAPMSAPFIRWPRRARRSRRRAREFPERSSWRSDRSAGLALVLIP